MEQTGKKKPEEGARPRALSLKPAADAYYGKPRELKRLGEVIGNVLVLVTPTDRRHGAYMARAARLSGLPKARNCAPRNPRPYAPKFDITAVSGRALGKLMARGIPWYVESCDLSAEGCRAIVEQRPINAALAFIVAYHAMLDLMKAERVRHDGQELCGESDDPDTLLTGYSRTEMRPGTAGRDALVWGALAAIPPREAEAFRLQYMYGNSPEEAAQRMGVTVGSFRTLASRGKASLKDYFGVTLRIRPTESL